MYIITCWVFFNLFKSFGEVGLILVGRRNDFWTHRHKLLDDSRVGRIQITGNEVRVFQVIKWVLFDETVPFIGATVDSHSEPGWKKSKNKNRIMMISGCGCSHANTVTETLTVVPQMPHQLWRIFNAGVQDDHGCVLQSQVFQGRPPISCLRGIGDHSQRTCKICRPPTRSKTSSLGSRFLLKRAVITVTTSEWLCDACNCELSTDYAQTTRTLTS